MSLRDDEQRFTCPVCGYTGLAEPPWTDEGGSQEICPRCKIQFGYDDAGGGDPARRAVIHGEWRERFERTRDVEEESGGG